MKQEIFCTITFSIHKYLKIVPKTLEMIWVKKNKEPLDKNDNTTLFFIDYRGKMIDEYVVKLIKTEAPIKPMITLNKGKTLPPSLKVGTNKSLSSDKMEKQRSRENRL